MLIRTMSRPERMYTYSQSQQISMQTGLIGYLRADMGTDGNGFFSSWNDFRKALKTPEFKEEFDNVINALREQDNFLGNRGRLRKYCYSDPELSFENDREFGVRVDTENYAYMMRLNPNRGEYNLYCYCYKKDWLDKHLENASRGIRFIDSGYNELFKVADGDKIQITLSTNETLERVCRFIDNYHVEIGKELYHICEFAEMMERNGNTAAPLKN